MPILRRDCPHCPTRDVGFDIKWAERNPRTGIWHGAATCGSCQRPICFEAQSGHPSYQSSGPTIVKGDVEPNFTIFEIFPTRSSSSAPRHTPAAVARRFIEGEDAYQRGSWNAAVSMYRSALDIATKGLPDVPPRKDFYNRLIWLHDNNRITPEIRSWADHVRVEGNEALHDPDDFTEEDAKPLRFFTEMFLRYVFELPGEVSAFRGEAPGAP